MSAIPVLETERLRLRRLTMDDLPFLAAWNADPVVARHLATGKPRSEEVTRAWLVETLDTYGADGTGQMGIVLKADGRLVGRTGLQWFEVEVDAERPRGFPGRGSAPPGVRTAPVLELGYVVAPELWG